MRARCESAHQTINFSTKVALGSAVPLRFFALGRIHTATAAAAAAAACAILALVGLGVANDSSRGRHHRDAVISVARTYLFQALAVRHGTSHGEIGEGRCRGQGERSGRVSVLEWCQCWSGGSTAINCDAELLHSPSRTLHAAECLVPHLVSHAREDGPLGSQHFDGLERLGQIEMRRVFSLNSRGNECH